MEMFKPYNVALLNGDLIDGKGEKSGGTELLTSDWKQQAQMAAAWIRRLDVKYIRATRGTPNHTGVTADMEDWVIDILKAEGIDAVIEEAGLYKVYGQTIDMRHFVPSSSIPHGVATPVLRSLLSALLWNTEDVQDMVDIFIRSHIHKAIQINVHNKLFIVTPALQGRGSKGARKWDNVVQFGFVVLDIYKDGRIEVNIRKIPGRSQRRKSEDLSSLMTNGKK
jgi:hypothetical protein